VPAKYQFLYPPKKARFLDVKEGSENLAHKGPKTKRFLGLFLDRKTGRARSSKQAGRPALANDVVAELRLSPLLIPHNP
jgi:hypothetical protein